MSPITTPIISKIISCLLVISVLAYGQTKKDLQQNHIYGVENLLYQGSYQKADSRMKQRVANAKKKDRLLYLMESASLFFTMGDYKKAKKLFLQAEASIDDIKKTRAKDIEAFLVNDTKQNFVGESFERVLVKFYLGLCQISLGERNQLLGP